MLNSISRLGETRPQQEWSNGTEFSGYCDFPEVKANLARKMSVPFAFWSNGKRPRSSTLLCIVREICYRLCSTCLFQRSPPILKERAGTAQEKSNFNNNLRKV